MVRRAVTDDRAVDSYDETRVVEHRSVASIIRNVLSVVYVAAIGLIGLDTLFRALHARQQNGFVSAVHSLASPLEAPFRGIFAHQNYWATALIAVVVYTFAYLIAMAALGRDRTY
jgi:multisubunit Na+/H+ antiporter MnhG subunit